MPGLRFFCDEHLGKLARWLRVIGQDTAYQNAIPDHELLARAAAEGRTVLTRDRRLPGRAGAVPVVVLEQNYPALQLREVVERFRGRLEVRVFCRCPVCNAETARADRDQVADRVPPYVLESQSAFTVCPDCGRVYWQATHRDRVDRVLKDLGIA